MKRTSEQQLRSESNVGGASRFTLVTMMTLTLGVVGLATMYGITNSVLVNQSQSVVSSHASNYIPALTVLMITVAVLFLLVCVNFANRLISRAQPSTSATF